MPSRLLKIYFICFLVLFLALFISILKLFHQKSLANLNISQSQKSSISTEIQLIDWATTTQLMSDCKVKSVFQKRDLTVTLRTYDNQIFQTTENQIDDIVKLAKEYQGPCDLIRIITE